MGQSDRRAIIWCCVVGLMTVGALALLARQSFKRFDDYARLRHDGQRLNGRVVACRYIEMDPSDHQRYRRGPVLAVRIEYVHPERGTSQFEEI